jgi:hypothetical protein
VTSKKKTREVPFHTPRGDVVKVKVDYDGPCDPTVLHDFVVNASPMQDVTVTGLVDEILYARGPDSGMGVFDLLTGIVYQVTGGLTDFPWREIGELVTTVSVNVHPSRFAYGIVHVHFTTPYDSPIAYGISADAYTHLQYTKLCWGELRYAVTDCGGLAEVLIPSCVELTITGSISADYSSFYVPLIDQSDSQVIYANVPEPEHPASTTPADAPSPPQDINVPGEWGTQPITYIVWDGLNRNDNFSIVPLQPIPGYSTEPVTGPSINLDMRIDRWIARHPQFTGPEPMLGDIKYGQPKKVGSIPCTLMENGQNGWYSYAQPPQQMIPFYKIEVYEWIPSQD